MKKLMLIVFAALALSGCATTEYEQYAKSAAAASVARSKALSDIAGQGDSTAKVAAVMALALGAGSGNVIAAPAPNSALQWASILMPGLTNIVGMRYNAITAQTQSNNATALGISTNGTFAAIAGQIQAPGSVTTNNLSGTGVLGTGTYTTDSHNTDSHSVDSHLVNPAPVVIVPGSPPAVAPLVTGASVVGP